MPSLHVKTVELWDVELRETVGISCGSKAPQRVNRMEEGHADREAGSREKGGAGRDPDPGRIAGLWRWRAGSSHRIDMTRTVCTVDS